MAAKSLFYRKKIGKILHLTIADISVEFVKWKPCKIFKPKNLFICTIDCIFHSIISG